jgi:hypothetical protein
MKKLLIVTMLMAACGGTADKGYDKPLTVDATTKTMLSGIVDKAAEVQTVATSPCSGDGINSLASLYESLTILLDLKLGKNASSAVAPALRAALVAGANKPQTSGCNAGTGTVTFDHFDFGEGTINGKITYSGGSFTTDVTVTLSTGTTSATIKETGSLALSSGAIKGDLEITANVSLGGATVNASFSSSFDLKLANGCATGGQIELHAVGNATGTSAGQHASYDEWVKAVFGPACGDVTVY